LAGEISPKLPESKSRFFLFTSTCTCTK